MKLEEDGKKGRQRENEGRIIERTRKKRKE
jgi:hypothetical protein